MTLGTIDRELGNLSSTNTTAGSYRNERLAIVRVTLRAVFENYGERHQLQLAFKPCALALNGCPASLQQRGQ